MALSQTGTRRSNLLTRDDLQASQRPTGVEMVRQMNDRQTHETTTEQDTKKASGRKLVSNFSQQKLRAWQPVLTPKWIISVFLGFGIIFVALGILLLITSNSVVQCTVKYEDPEKTCSDITECTTMVQKTIDVHNCIGPSPEKISPPIYIYYELTNYFQNHRRYVKSRNDEQLRGKVFTDAKDLSTCDPIITGPDSRIYHPCGLIAWSVFNDSFTLSKDSRRIPVNDDASVIAWSTDVKHKFNNPKDADPTLINEWLNPQIFPNKVADGHFIVWMRNAALPDFSWDVTFRKLYGQIEETVELPITVTIANRYPVDSFGGTKSVILSTTSWLGGRNSFLGIAYLVIGAWCLIFGIFFVFHKYKNPRILGDVRYLNWAGNRRPTYRVQAFISKSSENKIALGVDVFQSPGSSSDLKDAAYSYLQRQMFAGQIIGGRSAGTLAEDITDEAIDNMVNCDFYKDAPGRCYPKDVLSPCVYCKEKALRYFGHFNCPTEESFPPDLQHLYEWRLHPIKQKRKFRSVLVCMVHPTTQFSQQDYGQQPDNQQPDNQQPYRQKRSLQQPYGQQSYDQQRQQQGTSSAHCRTEIPMILGVLSTLLFL